jgi:hypothetical protein
MTMTPPPPHDTTGNGCWCDPERRGEVIVHRDIREVAVRLKHRVSSSIAGEDPGGDAWHWLGLATTLAWQWHGRANADQPR